MWLAGTSRLPFSWHTRGIWERIKRAGLLAATMLQTQGRAPIDDCHRFSDLHYPGQKQVAALSLVALAPAPSRGKQKLIGEVFRSSPPIEAQADGSSTATFKIDSTPFAVHGSTTTDKVFNNSTQAFRKVMLESGGSVLRCRMVLSSGTMLQQKVRQRRRKVVLSSEPRFNSQQREGQGLLYTASAQRAVSH